MRSNEGFEQESQRAKEVHDRAQTEWFDALKRVKDPATKSQDQIPCFSCEHRRHPVNVAPFAEVHFNNTEIMALRDTYNRERQRAAEERRICSQPGSSLGDSEVPGLHVWCDAHSRKQADGAVQEYAYCYRVLKALAPHGECPTFHSSAAASEERAKKRAVRAKEQEARDEEREKALNPFGLPHFSALSLRRKTDLPPK